MYTHTYLHGSDFKKSGAHQQQAGVRLCLAKNDGISGSIC